jgi:hypothetical protein
VNKSALCRACRVRPRAGERISWDVELERTTRAALIAGALLLALAAFALVMRLGVPSYRAGNDGKGASMRAALSAGRLDQAFALSRRWDDRDWTADGCFQIGSALVESNRIALGWAALEAAERIDGRHLGTRHALDRLRERVDLARGGERALLQQAAGSVELLCTVPSGPALGLLAMGLARYARDDAENDVFLDRLRARDRAALRAVKSCDDALKLTGRLLLESGRPAEASELLRPLVVARDTSPSADPDREAAWILSRAALQLDQNDEADLMLARSGDYRGGAVAQPEPASFVGSKRCGECHRRLYREQQLESRHALTLRFGPQLKDVPLPDRPIPDPVIPRISHAFSRKGADRIELESRVGDRIFKAIVAYAVGSGRHGITMIARDEAGLDRELRVSYYGEGNGWGETKGLEVAPGDGADHIGLAMSLPTLDRCLHCHTTWFRSVVPAQARSPAPEGYDRGIGCERCHGPGLNHVKAAETGFADLAIGLTSKTPMTERLSSCTGCHAADGTVEPSDPEFTRAQGTTLLFSKCYTASNHQLGCTTCHDPHRVLVTSTAHYESKCQSCHTLNSKANCPVNPQGQCISCHMPKVNDLSRRSRFTDHHIRRPIAASAAQRRQ